ncbi:Ribosomal protein L34e [Methanococcus vannielii SB]|jgi:large subunit ribosomal protein L34e|uniref:Large ribosomal subunit protein eL34 n=1 Tax=Methanococcus vannielii (strain ATCC 35089 / DSM 1224 / JCM 13029 / OCM 148 / SB) TaxID=406327 RepID=RL34_METVS|nr:50S ribosomal protein L34e [Methanococcus vannielii]A6USC2.1 RecName: Full=Large ribosomal subunit protein eL34; AltName: Full=50S ribosomal protein L34e [Methanococcus vannielii SB]ABR55394.1 Ribosomal protein L34e [Methanococcus vannielii SB]
MPAPRYKSGSAKKVYKRAPGNRRVLHIRRKKQSSAKCGACGALLNGVPSLRTVQVSKLSKTQRRPERAFGGALCPKCVKKMMVVKARNY